MWTREYVPITQPINIPQTDHSLWTREQHPVARPINVQETDSRDDFAQQHVLYCLQTLGEQRQEAMFVMSSLDFTDYLKKLDATHAAQFPLPGDLPATQREGDFDVIVIHRKYGVLLGEIKSVGIHGNNPTDKAVADKVSKAVKQLDKCERVVNHVMSDVAPGVSVRKTLILPYISRTQLQHVLDGDSQLAQGHPVVVLSLYPYSLAVSRLIQQQLVMTLQADPTTQQAAAAVHFLQYDLYNRPGDVEAALQTLQSLDTRRGHTETGANINPTSVGTTTSPPRLQYRDVLVVTRSEELREETRDVRGEQRQEAMFVMSSLDFTAYLNKLDATHAAQFPLPGDLPATQREGDFDVIVIHRKYGVLLGEIKSVGIHDNNPTDKAVADKVSKAVKQLDKCEKVVNHVMSDVAPGVSVRKTLILPYISRTQLQHVLDGDSQLAQVRNSLCLHNLS
nr:hypothetical protein BaRGS_017054 [Batillaria attramentaria]